MAGFQSLYQPGILTQAGAGVATSIRAGGAAWGQAFASLGQSIGQGVTQAAQINAPAFSKDVQAGAKSLQQADGTYDPAALAQLLVNHGTGRDLQNMSSLLQANAANIQTKAVYQKMVDLHQGTAAMNEPVGADFMNPQQSYRPQYFANPYPSSMSMDQFIEGGRGTLF